VGAGTDEWPAPGEQEIRHARTFDFSTLANGLVLGRFLIASGLIPMFR
jgi:hypothetical protein